MPTDLDQIIDVQFITDLQASDKQSALREMVGVMSRSPHITDPKDLLDKILEREKVISTGVGIGVALPHVKIPSVRDFVVAIGRSQRGIDFQSLDEKPVHLIVMIAANESQSGEFLKLMAKVVMRLKDKEFRRRALLASKPEEIRALFVAEDYRNLTCQGAPRLKPAPSSAARHGEAVLPRRGGKRRICFRGARHWPCARNGGKVKPPLARCGSP